MLRALKAVLSGFAGVRGRRGAKKDSQLHPAQIIAAAVFAVFCFVLLLLAIVSAVV